MATGTTTTGTSISNITGYRAYGKARSGENGDMWGVHEVFAGRTGTLVSTPCLWDADLSVEFDSEWRQFQFVATAGTGGSVDTSVNGADDDPVVTTGGTIGTINTVAIRAGIQVVGAVTLRNVVVTFERSGASSDTFSPTTGVGVNTKASPPPVAAEMILTVTPVDTTRTKVTVSGELRLEIDGPGLPADVEAAFVEVFVNGTAP